MVPEKNKEKNKSFHELHTLLENDMFEKLETIREYYGIKNFTEIIRFLITKEYRKIKG